MTYTMHDPFGAVEKVVSMAEARSKVAEFIAVAEYALRKFNAADSTDDEIFGTFDSVVNHWNHNSAVINKMENDPDFLLAQKKADYRKRAEDMRKMAKACLETFTPTSE